MDVFGVGEVGEKARTLECSPEAKDTEGFCVRGGEEIRECRGEGLECVGAFCGNLCTGSDGSAADVEEDEGGDDEGVAGDLGLLDVFVEEGSCVEAEVATAR